MKRIGVLGGMGPLASALFVRQVVEATLAGRDQDHIPVVLVSEPSVPDRTAFRLGTGPDPRPRLLEGARRLHDAGADLLVIPCNTANVWIADIASAVDLEPVSWFDCAITEIARVGASSVGLLATTGTISTGLYQERLGRCGVRAVLPTAAEQDVVMDAIYGPEGVKSIGSVTDNMRNRLNAVSARLAARGAEMLLLACTELPLAFTPSAAPSCLPLLDPSPAVARQAVLAAGGRLRIIAEGTPQ